jgi:hypothetical protein
MSQRPRGWIGPPPVTKQFLLSFAANGKTRLANFENYLSQNGLELRSPKEWELLRFAHSEGLGIIWAKAGGSLTWSDEAHNAWLDHRNGIACRYASARPPEALSTPGRAKLIKELVKRDGPSCVVCGQSPAEPTVEHLLDRKFGGTDHIANLTLACKSCNSELSLVKTLREKIEIIIRRRQDESNSKSCA